MSPTAESQKAADAAYRLAQTHIDSGAMKLVAVVYDADVLHKLLQHTGCRATCFSEFKALVRENAVDKAPSDTSPKPLKPSFYEVFDFVDEQHPDRAQLRQFVLESNEAAFKALGRPASPFTPRGTPIYPVFRPGKNDTYFVENAAQFQQEVEVPGGFEDGSVSVLTAPLRADAVIDLLGISFGPPVTNSGERLNEEIDDVDVRLYSLIVRNPIDGSLREVQIANTQPAIFQQALEGNCRDRALGYSSVVDDIPVTFNAILNLETAQIQGIPGPNVVGYRINALRKKR